eukprot:scaffold65527_cov44-Phaeocystis_antarctica.AAC.4
MGAKSMRSIHVSVAGGLLSRGSMRRCGDMGFAVVPMPGLCVWVFCGGGGAPSLVRVSLGGRAADRRTGALSLRLDDTLGEAVHLDARASEHDALSVRAKERQ